MDQVSHPVEAFLAELDREIWWEWHWEKVNRGWMWATNWGIWIARVLLLALGTYVVTDFGRATAQPWVAFSIAALAVMNIGLPLLSITFKFQQRQEVHDRNAREYSVIRVELEAGQIRLEQAVERFKEIRRRPTEVVIRQTP